MNVCINICVCVSQTLTLFPSDAAEITEYKAVPRRGAEAGAAGATGWPPRAQGRGSAGARAAGQSSDPSRAPPPRLWPSGGSARRSRLWRIPQL